jgi:hypothetical protein
MSGKQSRPRRSPGFSKSETCRRLGYNSRRLDKMIENGEIETVTLGGVVEIPPRELRRIMAMYEGEPETQAQTEAAE